MAVASFADGFSFSRTFCVPFGFKLCSIRRYTFPAIAQRVRFNVFAILEKDSRCASNICNVSTSRFVHKQLSMPLSFYKSPRPVNHVVHIDESKGGFHGYMFPVIFQQDGHFVHVDNANCTATAWTRPEQRAQRCVYFDSAGNVLSEPYIRHKGHLQYDNPSQ